MDVSGGQDSSSLKGRGESGGQRLYVVHSAEQANGKQNKASGAHTDTSLPLTSAPGVTCPNLPHTHKLSAPRKHQGESEE